MKLTSQLRLLPDAAQAVALLATMRAVNAAATYAARVGFDRKVYGQVSIHHLCYTEIRERFGLPSNIAIRAIGKAVECFARDKATCPVFRPDGAVPCSDRTYRIASAQLVSIATTSGRIKVPYVVADYFKGSLARKMGEADLVYRDGKFFLYISVQFDEPPPIEASDFIGVDLGIVQIATTDDGTAFSGKTTDTVRKRSARARTTYQRRNTRSARRRLKKMSKRQAGFQKHTNHVIAKKIVALAKGTGRGIAVEELNGIRSRITVRHTQRSRHSNWSFAQLRTFIEYKAKLAGIPLVAVDPRNTSKTCSACGHCDKKNRRSQGHFECLACGFKINADQNGAINIRLRALGANVSHPDSVAAPPN